MALAGEFYKLNALQLFDRLRERYGPVCKLGGMPGRPDMLLVHNVEDIELVSTTSICHGKTMVPCIKAPGL